jgi:hypothetical protein
MIHRTLPPTRGSRSPRQAQAHLRRHSTRGATADAGRAGARAVGRSAGALYWAMMCHRPQTDDDRRRPLLLALQRVSKCIRLSGRHAGPGARRAGAAHPPHAHHRAGPHAAAVDAGPAQGLSLCLRLVPVALDRWPDRCRAAPGVGRYRSSRPGKPLAEDALLEPTQADPARPSTRRSRQRALADGHPAVPQQGAQAQQHTLLFRDESGGYSWPSVVRPDAPIGYTSMRQEWWTRDHRSAISTISPGGRL